jgi:hypothetical protein
LHTSPAGKLRLDRLPEIRRLTVFTAPNPEWLPERAFEHIKAIVAKLEAREIEVV